MNITGGNVRLSGKCVECIIGMTAVTCHLGRVKAVREVWQF